MIRDEVRGAAPRETRRFTATEIRATENADSMTVDVEGYASVTGTPYEVRDYLGDYTEIIEPGSFAKTLKENADVRYLINHEGIPLARTASGTMSLKEDSTGLRVHASLDSRMTLANDLVIAIGRGDLTEMSFAFRAVKQTWSPDYQQRNIQEVQLFDVSAVTYPMSPATSVKLRAADFLINNLSDHDAEDFVKRYTKPEPVSVTAERLAMRRRQKALIDFR